MPVPPTEYSSTGVGLPGAAAGGAKAAGGGIAVPAYAWLTLSVLPLMLLTGDELRSSSRKSLCDLTTLDTCSTYAPTGEHHLACVASLLVFKIPLLLLLLLLSVEQDIGVAVLANASWGVAHMHMFGGVSP
jgi:hypothetical protein